MSETAKSKRELNREKKIEQVLDAARELIEEDGADALTLRRLASKTGLATNTIYAQFGSSREDIVRAVIMRAFEDIGDTDDRNLDLYTPGNTPWDLAIDQFAENPEFYRAVTLLRTPEEPLYEAEARLGKLNLTGRRLIKAAVEDGFLEEGADLEFLETYFIHSFRGCANRWARREINLDEFRHYHLYAIYTALYFSATRKGRRKFEVFLSNESG